MTILTPCLALLVAASFPLHGLASQEVFAKRTYFYTGGQYVEATEPGPNQTDGTAQYMVGQIYVERLVPSTVKHKHPLVFNHGISQTGTNWLNTPDDREGWASFFLRQGYVVYLTDQPSRGRSPSLDAAGETSVFSSEAASNYFTAQEKVKPLGYPQAKLHTQWPGTGLQGDPTFDAFYASQVQSLANFTLTAVLNLHAYVALLEKINEPVILVTHSQSGILGWQIADAKPDLIAGIVAIEPGTGPFESWIGPPYSPGYLAQFPPVTYGITILPITYDPPLPGNNPKALKRKHVPPPSKDLAPCILQAEPARKLTNLAKIPVLEILGEASFHAPIEYCTAKYLKQAGVKVDFVNLGTAGLPGNGHFSFMEKNNIEIAEKVVMPWLKKVGG